MLTRGYALAGAGMGPPTGTLWVLGTAVSDQFETLDQVKRTVLPHRPDHVLAVGTSMGGLISSLEAEQARGRIDAALSTCGIVYGGVTLSNYQLDGEYAMARLLAPGQSIQLTSYADAGAAGAAAAQLQAIGVQAQTSPQGRARLALAMAFLNVTDWDPTAPAASRAQRPRRRRGRPVRRRVRLPRVPDHPVHGHRATADRAGGGWQLLMDEGRRLRARASPLALPARRSCALPRRWPGPPSRPARSAEHADIAADPAALAWSSVPQCRPAACRCRH